MNWIDLVLMLVIGSSVLAGFAAGFARVGVGFAAMIVGMFCGFWFYGIVAGVRARLRQLARDRESDRILCDPDGGADSWARSWDAFWRSFSNGSGLSWLDRLLGGAFGVVRGFVIAAAMVTVLLAFAPSPPPPSVVDSKLLPYVIDVSDVLAALTPREIKDQFYATQGQSEGGLVRA